MSCLFGKIPFALLIFDENDNEEEEEERVDFCIEEIRCCDCFFDEVLFFIEKNNYKINFKKLFDKFFYLTRKLKINDVFMYYSSITIFCCEFTLNFYSKHEEVDKYEMDKYCLAEEIDFRCFYYLSRETIFNCICDNCQKTLLKLASRKLNSIKLNDRN